MAELLVSVRSADEAKAALAGSADIIDIKEPDHGSLGRASHAALDAILNCIAGRRPDRLFAASMAHAQGTRGSRKPGGKTEVSGHHIEPRAHTSETRVTVGEVVTGRQFRSG